MQYRFTQTILHSLKELRFEDMQKELSIRKKKSIKEQIKKFLRNHNIIHV